MALKHRRQNVVPNGLQTKDYSNERQNVENAVIVHMGFASCRRTTIQHTYSTLAKHGTPENFSGPPAN